MSSAKIPLITFLLSLFLVVFPTTTMAEDTTMDDVFSMSLTELLELEIYSASKSSETIKEIPASIYIVTRADIDRYGYRTLTDVLTNVPGMYNIYSYNGLSGNFGMRGFWNPNQQNSSFVILINGVHQYAFEARSSPMMLIPVPVEAIDRVEVVRGPNAVIYGNGASFGVINIITNESSDSLLAASYGSQNTERVAARLAIQENDLKLVLNAGFYKTDGLDNKFSDLMGEDNLNLLPALGVDDPQYSTKKLLEQKTRYVNLSGSYQDWYFDMSFSKADSEFFILVPAVEDGSLNSTDSIHLTVGFKKDINPWLDMDLKGSYYNYDRTTEYDGFSPSFYGVVDLSYDAYDVELLANIKPVDDLNILVGLNYKGMSDMEEVTDIPDLGINNDLYEVDDRPTQAIFTQLTQQISQKLRLTAGIRYEEMKQYDRVLVADSGSGNESLSVTERGNIYITSPRLAVVYTFDENNIVKLMYGKSSRISDDNFDPEETKTLEANYLYLTGRLQTSVSLFHNSLRNLLVPTLVDDGMGGVDTSEDTTGNISTYGTELILQYDMTEDWLGELGVTYQETKNKENSSIEVAYSPDILLHLKTAYTYENVIFSVIGRYVDSMESYYDETIDNGDGSYGNRVGDEVDGAIVVDANVRVNELYKGVYLNLKATNIFDSEVRYPNNNDNNTMLDQGPLGQGFEMMATIGLKF